jgi:ATP-dependent RNA helicase DDX10/DBP4
LSPTRELAVQIFQVLKVAGKYHSFSVGLLIGGKKDFQDEQQRVGSTNILIATPGRLLQHLEQTPYFDVGSLQILVLDEADRILDLGFRDQLLRILEYLPRERQTLLFSATQTRDVSNIATMSLNKPEYIGVHDKEKTSTPESLQQSYVVVPLEHKLNAIYSFVKTHLRCKSIVFMASCAQVRHAWELFCSLRPGVPILALHGKLVQTKRTQIYFDFLQRPHAVLFATDIAARGLDFPNVDWVVQCDAPEDRDMYIHRAGRTARYRADGKSLLIVTPAEAKKGLIEMIQGNNANKIPIKKLGINPTKTTIVTQRAASNVASNVHLHEMAKKAYKNYVRSISLMPLKEIFNVADLPLDDFSASLGLASAPNLRFLKKTEMDRDSFREKKNVNHKLQRLKDQIRAEKLAKKLRKLGKSEDEVNDALSSKHETNHNDDNADSDDDLLLSKREQTWKNETVVDEEPVGLSLASAVRNPKKIRIDGTNINNKRVVFDDDGQAEDPTACMAAEQTDEIAKDKLGLGKANVEYVERVRHRLHDNAERDRMDEKERIRQKHKKRRLQEKGDKDDNVSGDMGGVAMMGTAEVESQSESDDDSRASSSNTNFDATGRSVASDLDIKAQEDLALSLIRGRN